MPFEPALTASRDQRDAVVGTEGASHPGASPTARSASAAAALSFSIADVLRSAAGAGAADPSRDESLAIALRPVCREARMAGIQAEHVIIAWKSVWRSLPEVQRLRRDIADEILARVITITIAEFFDDVRLVSGPDDVGEPRSAYPPAATDVRAGT